jgi:PAS domain S-box-containing protein
MYATAQGTNAVRKSGGQVNPSQPNLRLQDRQLRAVIDQVSDGVLIESKERIAYVNPAYAKLLGYPSTSEIASASIRDIAHPEDFERLTWYSRLRREGKPAPNRYTFRALRRNRDCVTFDATISTTRVDGEVLITTIVRELALPEESDVSFDVALAGTKPLSPREIEVIRHLLDGRRSKEIANMLDVSEKTICTHRSRAFGKLALRGISDLFRVATERGWISHGRRSD